MKNSRRDFLRSTTKALAIIPAGIAINNAALASSNKITTFFNEDRKNCIN